MTNSRTTKKALLSSALALTMCVAMLLATTFAWFTDTASSSVNKIQAGTLDVKIEYANNATGTGGDATWTEVETDTPLKFLQKSGESDTAAPATDTILWDPGSTWENSYTGGTVIIDGAKVYDENNAKTITASLVKNVSGTMIIKGGAELSSTKALGCDGGTVYVKSATITGTTYAVKAAVESPATEAVVEVTKANVTITGVVKAESGGKIVGYELSES